MDINGLKVLAEKLFDKGDLAGEIEILTKIIVSELTTEEQRARAYYNRGVVYLEEKQYDEAIEDYTEAIRIKPNYAVAYFNRGIAYGKKELYDKAIEDCTEAIRLNPNYAEAYYNRGNAYVEKEQYDKAIEDYTEAIRLNPNYAGAYSNRGVAYDKKELYDKAIDDYTEAIKLNPNYAGAYLNRGNAYDKKKLYDKSIEDYTEAIRINPNFAEAYFNRGDAYAAQEQYDKAIDDFTEAIRIKPEFSVAYFIRGLVYLEINNFEKAESDFNDALKGVIAQHNNIGCKVYKFTSINKNTIETLCNKDIYLASPSNFNDPMDSPILQSELLKENKPLHNAFKQIRSACFVACNKDNEDNINNILMWSHYADAHNGIAIEYDFDEYDFKESAFKEVQYKPAAKYSIDYPLLFSAKFDILDNGFYTKNKCWKYEHEYRLISYGKELLKAPPIKSITFGFKCPEKDQDLIRKIIKDKTDNQDIKYYCMEIDPDTNMSLIRKSCTK